MKAILFVVPNRCWARADAQGRFLISDVPPGRYMLVGWNDRGGEQRQIIDVSPAGLQGLSLALSPSAAREQLVERAAPPEPTGVARGLGVKRERLGLPVVGGAQSGAESLKIALQALPNRNEGHRCALVQSCF